jgi:hypothetical protein
LLVQRNATVGLDDTQAVDLRANVEETLGSKKEAVLRSPDGPDRPNKIVKLRVRRSRREVEF